MRKEGREGGKKGEIEGDSQVPQIKGYSICIESVHTLLFK